MTMKIEKFISIIIRVLNHIMFEINKMQIMKTEMTKYFNTNILSY